MSLSYRGDIDGLRAIAVLAVVIFHAFPAILPGGYLGVDIFFVISGFLITSILLREMREARDRGGRWNWRGFYERRARRILPVLLVVLAASSIAAQILLGGEALHDYGQSLLASLGFVANWYFLGQTGYFDAPAHSQPLLHIWSLGIEEQYYLLFPLILWPLFRVSPRAILPVISGLTLLSLGLFIWTAFRDADLAFYGLHTRFWQIGAGSLLAFFGASGRPGPLSRFFLAISAAIFIGLGLSLTTERLWQSIELKSLLAVISPLLIVIGTGLLIWVGGKAQTLINRMLAISPMRGIGNISYGLYLWHWPILVFLPLIVPQPSVALRLAAIAVAALLAMLCYVVFENPIRARSLLRSARKLWLTALAGIATLVIISISFISGFAFPGFQNVSKDAYEAERLSQIRQFNSDAGRPYCWMSTPDYMAAAARKCVDISPDKPNVLIIGDSHAAQYFGSFKALYPDISFSTLAANSCSMMEQHLIPAQAACRALLDYLKTEAPLSEFDVIIIVSRHHLMDWRDDFIDEVKYYRTRFNGRLIVMGTITFYEPSAPQLYAANIDASPAEIDAIFDAAVYRDIFEVDRYLQNRFAAIDDIEFVSTLDVLCPQGPQTCRHTTPEGWPILVDNSHLAPSAAQALLTELKQRRLLVLP